MTSSLIPVKTGTGGQISVAGIVLADGSIAPVHVLCDASGTPHSASNPLPSAPAISVVHFTDHSGTITTAGAAAADIAADPTRKGGSIRANVANQGTITVTLKNAGGSTHAEMLEAGAVFPLTMNGYVIQDEIVLSGDTVGDRFTGVTYS